MPTADRAPHAVEPSPASMTSLMRVAQLAEEIIAKVLRRKLSMAGMENLALAIDGSTTHHYGLMFAGQF